MKVEFYRDISGDWRWRLMSRNGRIVADSGEGYRRKGACARSFDSIVAGLRKADPQRSFKDKSA